MPGRRRSRRATNQSADESVDTILPRKANQSPSTTMLAPSTPTKDLRSPAVPIKRNKTRNTKYFNFNTVKPLQATQPHYIAPETNQWSTSWFTYPADLTTCDTVPGLTKRQFYEHAKATAPSTMSRDACSCCVRYREQHVQRVRKEPKNEAHQWLKDGQRKDFGGRGGGGHLDYDQVRYDQIVDHDMENMCEYSGCSCRDGFEFPDDTDCRGEHEDDQPQVVYDLTLLVDRALAGLDVAASDAQSVGGWGFESIGLGSPASVWAIEELVMSDEEDFEWV